MTEDNTNPINPKQLIANDYLQKVNNIIAKLKENNILGPQENISAEGIVSQILLETGYGSSNLVKTANNFGGIKADKNWKGDKTPSGYRRYNSPEEGLEAQVMFYVNNPRYRKAGVFQATNALEHLEAVQRAKYAEDPKYVSKTASIANNFFGTNFDTKNVAENNGQPQTQQTAYSNNQFSQNLKVPEYAETFNAKPIEIAQKYVPQDNTAVYINNTNTQNTLPDLNVSSEDMLKSKWFGTGNTAIGGDKPKKFENGGNMEQLTQFNEGGTHEENPLQYTLSNGKILIFY